VSNPHDPHQPQDPSQEHEQPYGGPPPQQQYGGYQYPGGPAQQYAAGPSAPYGGYPTLPYGGFPPAQYGGWPAQESAAPPRRPGTLITAGVLWLLNGAFLLLIGGVAVIADRMPGVEEVYAENPDVTPEMVRVFGLVTTPIAIAMIGLAIMVFTGATWARILITVLGVPVALAGIALVILPLLTIVAIVLQFLPASNAYASARRAHA
jgi:hypothetical protein